MNFYEVYFLDDEETSKFGYCYKIDEIDENNIRVKMFGNNSSYRDTEELIRDNDFLKLVFKGGFNSYKDVFKVVREHRHANR